MINVQNVDLSESITSTCNATFVISVSYHKVLHPVARFFKNIGKKRACTWIA